MNNRSSNTPSGAAIVNRSPLLLDRRQSGLLVVDIQEKLLPVIPQAQRLRWNVRRLLLAATELSVPVAVTEQYPEKLGGTVQDLAELLPNPHSKRMFSCRECWSAVVTDRMKHRRQLVLCGIETHVCVQQTVLDLLADRDIFVVVDAVGARSKLDHDSALRRMELAGAVLVTTESVLFEWCETSLATEFKTISRLVREAPP